MIKIRYGIHTQYNILGILQFCIFRNPTVEFK